MNAAADLSADWEFDEERLAAAVRPYPARRAVLYALLCLLWAMPGTVGRDPWKPVETETAAVVKHAAENFLPLVPIFAGEIYAEHPPLYIWATAAAAKIGAVFSLELHEGARFINVVFLLAAFAALGFAVGRRHGANAGWLAPVIAVGLTGLLARGHFLDPAVFAFCGAAFALFGVLLTTRAAFAGGAVFGLAAGMLFLSGGFGALIPAAALFLLPLISKRWREARIAAGFIAALAFAAPLIVFWPLLLHHRAPDAYALWLAAEAARLSSFSDVPRASAAFVKTAAWAAWPAWALAMLYIIQKRFFIGAEQLPRARELIFADKFTGGDAGGDLETAPCLLFFAAAALVFILTGGRGEGDFLGALPPLVILAAAWTPRIARGRVIALDWFALLVVGVFFVGGQWLALVAVKTGFPAAAAKWTRDLIPAEAAAGGFAIAAAAALTLGWALLAAKFGYSKERAIVNWSCGLALVWALFSLLWMDAVDAGRSYRKLAAAVANETGSDCVAMRGLSTAHIGQLYYFADISPAPPDARCDWLLVFSGKGAINKEVWEERLTRGRFIGDDESFALYQRRF